MQGHAKIWIISLAVSIFGCAKEALDEAGRGPSPRATTSPDGMPNGYAPYNPNHGGSGGLVEQAAKGGGSPAFASSAGHAGSAADAAGLAGASGGAGVSGGMGGVSSAGASAATAGSGGSAVSGAAGAETGSAAACPSLTRARLPSGACVDRIVEFTVATNPTNIVTGSDGAIWVDDDSNNQILRLESDGHVLGRLDCDASSSPRALLSGSGQTVIWYTDAHERTLVGVDNNLQRSAFGLNFVAAGLVHGEADELWLTEAGQAVYRLSPSKSTLTKFPASPSSTIVFGPDKKLWFPESALIGRLTPDLEKTSFSIGDAFASDLSGGPDAALWFSDDIGARIGRLAVDGTLSKLYHLPPGSSPFRIITGPDGALWFSERDADKIGRIDVNGVMTHYPIPTRGGAPYALTVGADHNIWFTENGSGKVGRLIPDRGV